MIFLLICIASYDYTKNAGIDQDVEIDEDAIISLELEDFATIRRDYEAIQEIFEGKNESDNEPPSIFPGLIIIQRT